jgi:hypothetical protein
MMKKRKIVSLFVIGATVTASVCLAQISESLQAVAQPAPNIPYGIYAHQGHNYYWSNSRKFTCHVVGPVQLKLFIKPTFRTSKSSIQKLHLRVMKN